MTTKELVGPLPTVSFRGGPGGSWRSPRALPKVPYVPPRDTLDPRYDACTKHRVACDCREAEFAEQLSEYRAERRELQQAFDTILAGHPTWQWSPDGNAQTGCMCTGCHRAVCEDPAGSKTTTGVGYTLTVHWRTWLWFEVRAASLAADHNRTRHGAK